MHNRFFFIFNPERASNEAMTSEMAREYARIELENDGSFCGEGGRFSSPIADWFSIGGRWSGELSTPKNEKWEEKVHKICGHKCKYANSKKYTGDCVGFFQEEIIKHKKAIQKQWEKAGGKGVCSYLRGSVDDGYDDDAMLITEEIYDRFLKQYEGSDTDRENFVDYNCDEISRNIIGKKWIVVIDYHW